MNKSRPSGMGMGGTTSGMDDHSDDDDDDEANIPLMPSLPQLSMQKRNSMKMPGGLNESSRKLLKTGSTFFCVPLLI